MCVCAIQAKQALSKNCELLIQHTKARKLKYIPLEILSTEEVNDRLEVIRD